jgi:hypothetical protein
MREEYEQQFPDVQFTGFRTGTDLAEY